MSRSQSNTYDTLRDQKSHRFSTFDVKEEAWTWTRPAGFVEDSSGSCRDSSGGLSLKGRDILRHNRSAQIRVTCDECLQRIKNPASLSVWCHMSFGDHWFCRMQQLNPKPQSDFTKRKSGDLPKSRQDNSFIP